MRFDLSRTVLTVAIVVVMASSIPAAPPPGVPHQFAYQGRLTNNTGTPVSDGLHQVVFRVYDSSTTEPALQIWSSGKVEVATTAGLFSINLGAAPQPEPTLELFMDTSLWLGITIGDDPELEPRTKLTSVPFAFKAEQANNAFTATSAITAGTATTAPGYLPLSGGTMTGTTLHNDVTSKWQSGGADRVVVDPNNRKIQIIGSNGVERARLCDEGSGELILYDSSLSTGGSALLSGVGLLGGKGGNLMLVDSTGSLKIWMDAGGTGNASVVLPDDAIDSREILDEPGIAQTTAGSFDLLTYGFWTEIVSVWISIPGPGYIVVDASAQGLIGGVDYSIGQIQIAEGAPEPSDVTHTRDFATRRGTSTVDEVCLPISLTRTYYEAAGTYAFRIYATKKIASGGYVYVFYPTLRATYYPTSYGWVATVVSSGEAGQFDKAEAVSVPTGPDGKGPSTTMYQVDLRELELRAAKATADAERLKRELAEAKLNEMRKQQVQNESDKQ